MAPPAAELAPPAAELAPPAAELAPAVSKDFKQPFNLGSRPGWRASCNTGGWIDGVCGRSFDRARIPKRLLSGTASGDTRGGGRRRRPADAAAAAAADRGGAFFSSAEKKCGNNATHQCNGPEKCEYALTREAGGWGSRGLAVPTWHRLCDRGLCSRTEVGERHYLRGFPSDARSQKCWVLGEPPRAPRAPRPPRWPVGPHREGWPARASRPPPRRDRVPRVTHS